MPTETERELSEAEILAELTPEEAGTNGWRVSSAAFGSLLYSLAAERRTVRELRAALSGRTMYDAAAVEREACAAMVESLADSNTSAVQMAEIARRIRARGDDGGAHGE